LPGWKRRSVTATNDSIGKRMQVRSQGQDRDKRLTRDMQKKKKKKRGAEEERELKGEEEKSRVEACC
jgi:hypothetical protein